MVSTELYSALQSHNITVARRLMDEYVQDNIQKGEDLDWDLVGQYFDSVSGMAKDDRVVRNLIKNFRIPLDLLLDLALPVDLLKIQIRNLKEAQEYYDYLRDTVDGRRTAIIMAPLIESLVKDDFDLSSPAFKSSPIDSKFLHKEVMDQVKEIIMTYELTTNGANFLIVNGMQTVAKVLDSRYRSLYQNVWSLIG